MTIPHHLLQGYMSFVDMRLPVERDRFERLAATGQKPGTLVISCCDSRVSPEVIFDAHPGELFVIRNIANLVPPYQTDGAVCDVWAAIEFAVLVLKVKHIIVLGHSHCGGIRAFIEHDDHSGTLKSIFDWVKLIQPAAESIGEQHGHMHVEGFTHLEQASILTTLENLMTFPWIAPLVERGELTLIGAYFDVASGVLAIHEEATGHFQPVIERQSDRLQRSANLA